MAKFNMMTNVSKYQLESIRSTAKSIVEQIDGILYVETQQDTNESSDSIPEDTMDNKMGITSRASGVERLWRLTRGASPEKMLQRRDDFAYLYEKYFEDTRDMENGIRRSDIADAIFGSCDKDTRTSEICERQRLNQPMSLGYRAFILYLTMRGAYFSVKDGNEYIFGVRVKRS